MQNDTFSGKHFNYALPLPVLSLLIMELVKYMPVLPLTRLAEVQQRHAKLAEICSQYFSTVNKFLP